MTHGVTAVTEPGTLSLCENEALLVKIDGDSFRIEPKDVRALILHGRVVPIVQVRRKIPGDDDCKVKDTFIEGHAAINRAGKAVVFYTRAGHFIVPLVSFHRVARGEAVSAPLFPLFPECQDGPA